jgi:hypothetical protein
MLRTCGVCRKPNEEFNYLVVSPDVKKVNLSYEYDDAEEHDTIAVCKDCLKETFVCGLCKQRCYSQTGFCCAYKGTTLCPVCAPSFSVLSAHRVKRSNNN